jgi:hypothetical protein
MSTPGWAFLNWSKIDCHTARWFAPLNATLMVSVSAAALTGNDIAAAPVAAAIAIAAAARTPRAFSAFMVMRCLQWFLRSGALLFSSYSVAIQLR